MEIRTETERRKLFADIWLEALEPALSEMQDEKQKEKKIAIACGVMPFLLPIGFLIIKEFHLNLTQSVIIAILCIIGLILSLLTVKHNKNIYLHNYKEKVLDLLLGYTKLKWSFVKYGNIPFYAYGYNPKKYKKEYKSYTQSFIDSGLCDKHGRSIPDEILRAEYFGTEIIMTEMSIMHTANFSYKDHTRERELFNEFFINIKINKPFIGETYVQTHQDAENLFSTSKLISDNSKKELVSLEWNDFGNFLKVLTTNQREAREIFTPDFMALLHDWWIVHKRNIRFSFKGNHIYFTIPSYVDFEPSVYTSYDEEKELMRDHLELLWFVDEIVEFLIEHNKNKI